VAVAVGGSVGEGLDDWCMAGMVSRLGLTETSRPG
jgi:hypothetical protein